MADISPALDGSPRVVDVSTRYGILSICDRPANRHRGKRESAVWQLGKTYASNNNPGVVKAWRCDQCKDFILLPGGMPSNADKHLQKVHNIFINRRQQTQPSSDVESNVESTTGTPSIVESTQPTRPRIAEMLFSPKVKEWRRDLLAFLLATHTPFNVVNTPEFKRWQLSASPALELYLPGNNAVRNWAEKEFDVARRKIGVMMKEALSKIHISFDVWTADYSKYALLGVVAHFVARVDGKLSTQSILLGLRRLTESHTSEYVGEVLTQVLQDFEVSPAQLGVFVADSGSENNGAVQRVLAYFLPDLKDITGRRVRCLAHIINLAAKQFLYGRDPQVFEEEVAKLELNEFDATAVREAQAAWKKKGAHGKLHNIIVFIRKSSKRKEEFRNIRVGEQSADGKFISLYVVLNKFGNHQKCYQQMPQASGTTQALNQEWKEVKPN